MGSSFSTLPLLQSILYTAVALIILHSRGITLQRRTLPIVSHHPNIQPKLFHVSLQVLYGLVHARFTASFLATTTSNSTFQTSRITTNSWKCSTLSPLWGLSLTIPSSWNTFSSCSSPLRCLPGWLSFSPLSVSSPGSFLCHSLTPSLGGFPA